MSTVPPIFTRDIELPNAPDTDLLNDLESDERIYIIFFRHGVNPHCQKGFRFKGTMKEAVHRAKQHCQRMGYRFIFIRPLISDLDYDEKYRENHNNLGELEGIL